MSDHLNLWLDRNRGFPERHLPWGLDGGFDLCVVFRLCGRHAGGLDNPGLGTDGKSRLDPGIGAMHLTGFDAGLRRDLATGPDLI